MRVVHSAEHRHAEAEAARRRANEMQDAAARRIMLRVANVCDTLAKQAERVEASRRGPSVEPTEKSPATLGDVLYAKPKALVSEDD